MAQAEELIAEAMARATYVHIAPNKVRIVLELIRGKAVEEAQAILRFTPKRAAKVVAKVLKSAAANAVNNHHMDEDRLYVALAYADGGPVMKRIQPHMRGQAFSILRRTSHITIVLREREEG